MSKIMELADAYAGYVYGSTSAKLARKALAAEMEKLEAEHELSGKTLRSVVEQHKELLAERDALRQELKCYTEYAERKLALVEKDAARYRFAQSKYWVTKVYSNGDTELMYDNDIDAAMEQTK